MEREQWQYWNESDEERILESAAFVYMIEFDTGEFYIGQKRIYKGIKDSKRIKHDSIQSNWESYESSSTEVSNRCASGERFRKTILAVFDTYQEALFVETCLICFATNSELNLNKAIIAKLRLTDRIKSTKCQQVVRVLLEDLQWLN